MAEGFRVAVASSTGREVDFHFGHADQFFVFELREDRGEFVEVRKVPESGEEVEGLADLDALVDLVGDCAVVVCGKAGPHARTRLFSRGIRVVESAARVIAALDDLRPHAPTRRRKAAA
jgi:predicted Fe-Mo cluster-binding NifX family protein